MLIPFRYKLSLIISVVTLLILSLAFAAVDREIEKEFRKVIEQRLQQAVDVVNQRMQDRYERLFSQAITASESKLIQDVLTDRGLSRTTCDDIIREEILPNLTQADELLVTDAEGDLLADSSQNDHLWQYLIAASSLADGIAGEQVTGITVLDDRWQQWLLLPVFIGDQLFGTVILVSTLGEKDLLEISQLTGTELLTISGDSFLATSWNQHKDSTKIDDSNTINPVFYDFVKNSGEGQYQGASTKEVNLEGERMLLRHNQPGNPFIPEFIVGQSLDSALAFVTTIKQVMLVIALIGLFLAGALGFLFASSVSRPIRTLAGATHAIADEDFSQRVDIRTHDEFHELGESFNQMSASLAEKASIRQALDKSVSRDVADHLLQQGVQLGGESREATIVFADIRGFTSLAEQLTENQLLELLNEYFARINICIDKHHGTIDKFIGDAVMAIFGAPLDDDQHALHAIQAAMDMCQAVEKYNQEVSTRYGCEINIGIGINSGRVVSGLVGSQDRLNYTVLGDQVNIASRMENLTRYYGSGIIITEQTRDVVIEQAAGELPYLFRYLDRVQVKGKTVGVNLYQPVYAREGVDKKLQAYDKALQLLSLEKFLQAQQEFEKLATLWPSDRVISAWLERVRSYQQQPKNFRRDYVDGVRVFAAKR